ncbi:AAA family ATPase [Nocardia carnea]|uniref:AAA family ATPase n=1 Tax=Nocardia carnea TaxID=37328 RepID=UPI002455F805|nr:AAA family ATPase [Nocardia carnea]
MVTDFTRPVTIAVTGTHSTGKSSFLHALAEQLHRDGIEVAIVADLGAEAVAHRLPILDRHTWATTLWFITRGIAAETHAWLNADVVLVDRPVSDALAYYEAALEFRGEQPEPQNMTQLEALVTHHTRNYDLILRTVLDHTIPLDLSKPRGTDLEFRALADRHVAKVLERHGIEHDQLLSNGRTRAVVEARAFIHGRLDGVEPDEQG